jgi:hypothetical protein
MKVMEAVQEWQCRASWISSEPIGSLTFRPIGRDGSDHLKYGLSVITSRDGVVPCALKADCGRDDESHGVARNR